LVIVLCQTALLCRIPPFLWQKGRLRRRNCRATIPGLRVRVATF